MVQFVRAALIFCWPLTSLCACASYKPQPLDPASNIASFESRRLDDKRLTAFVVAATPDQAAELQTGHWTAATLTLAALYFHPDLPVARAKLALAEAAAITADELPNPLVTFSPAKHSSAIDPPLTVGGAIELLLSALRDRSALEEQAESQSAAARAELVTAQWQVRGAVQAEILKLWSVDARRALASRQRSVELDLVAAIERRAVEGAVSASTLDRERANLARVTLATIDLENERATARRSLAQAVGVPAEALDAVAVSAEQAETDCAMVKTPELRRAALLGRSDIKSSIASYQSAEAALRLEVGRQFPDLRLGSSYAYQEGDNEYVFSLSSEIPLFNQHHGPIAEALARRQQAAAQVEALQDRIVGEIDAAAAACAAASARRTAVQALADHQAARQDAVERSFQAGDADRPVLLAARLESLELDRSRLDAAIQARTATLELEAALQTPFDDTDRRVLPRPGDALAILARAGS